MSRVLTIPQLIDDHWKRCGAEARRLFRDAVRPIFRRLHDGRPELVGSSVLVQIDGRKWIITAAHVLDGHAEASLHLGTRSEIIPLNSTFHATTKVDAARAGDAVDVAIAELSDEQLQKLEDLPFVGMSNQIVEPPTRSTDFFLTMGYRCSQNRPPMPGQTRLPVTIWSYKGLGTAVPSPEKRQFGGCYNFAVDYPKRAVNTNSGKVTMTTPPRGVSGGAIFHLGDLASVEQLGSSSPRRPMLAGIVIECQKGSRVLIGTNMLSIHYAIDTSKSIG